MARFNARAAPDHAALAKIADERASRDRERAEAKAVVAAQVKAEHDAVVRAAAEEMRRSEALRLAQEVEAQRQADQAAEDQAALAVCQKAARDAKYAARQARQRRR